MKKRLECSCFGWARGRCDEGGTVLEWSGIYFYHRECGGQPKAFRLSELSQRCKAKGQILQMMENYCLKSFPLIKNQKSS